MDQTTLWNNLKLRAKYLSSMGEDKVNDLNVAKMPEIIFALVEAIEQLQDQVDELKKRMDLGIG
jgi:hypothetical protein